MLSTVLKNIKIVEPREYNFKLVNHRCHYDLRKYFFCTGTVCQNLSYLLVRITDAFKNKLDNFWSNQGLIYNYKAELTGIGNKSFINNLFIDNVQFAQIMLYVI